MNGCNWHTDELHIAILLAVKRTVMTVSKWPLVDRHNHIMMSVSYLEMLATAGDPLWAVRRCNDDFEYR